MTELIIAVGVVALAAGALVPMFGSTTHSTRVGKTLKTIEAPSQACEQRHAETGAWPIGQTGEPEPGAPLLGRPMAAADVPVAVTWRIHGTAHTADIAGFDLDGDGTAEIAGGGCCLELSSVREQDAHELDRALDGDVRGDWFKLGRVRFQYGNLYVLLAR